MGTTYYAYAAASGGANDGSKAGPWEGVAGLQTGLDALVAGDTLFIAGTYTLAAALDIDQASGADGTPIRVIGCDYDGGEFTVDGTKAVIDANDAAVNCLTVEDKDWWIWENVEFCNATGSNLHVTATASGMYWVFLRCDSHDAGGDGWGTTGAKFWGYCHFIRCRAWSNDVDGFGDGYGPGGFHECISIGNGQDGFEVKYGMIAEGCIAHANTRFGFFGTSLQSASIARCVADGNGSDGIYINTGPGAVLGCRLTNNGRYGLSLGSTKTVLELNNVILGNATAPVAGGVTIHEDGGAETRITEGVAGYENLAGDVFNCRLGAAGYRTEIDLGGGNYARLCPGLPTMILPKLGGNER
ncbi:MAG TPA: right-handed parallel beta-helix repeat-containing protein [Phycisphaerae bacterium]|nr:right-handed parallel beta-helix repeat-containing protein [Phycisphaerae bacterium]